MTAEEKFQLAAGRYDAGDARQARALLEEIVAQSPQHADACHLLGMICFEEGDATRAAELIGRAVAAQLRIDYLHNFGLALAAIGRRDEARQALSSAAQLAAADPEQLRQVARAFCLARLYPESIECLRPILSADPTDFDSLTIVGSAMLEMGRHAAAEAIFRNLVSRRPDSAGTHWNLAMLLLAQGKYAEGWREFEWRHALESNFTDRRFTSPQWNGDPLAGGTLLVHSEGGFGDVLQYLRYLPLIRSRATRLVFECQPELFPLLDEMKIDELLPRGAKLPPFHAHVFLSSLPRILGTEPHNIPAQVPYVTIPRQRLERWKEKIPAGGAKKIGLVWSGNQRGLSADKRSNSLALFAPLAQIPNLRFFSLQLGLAASQLRPAGMELIDLTKEIADFADTGAILSHLDLLITVDTSVAHLAGALARPVWMLTPFAPDYRWMLEREDSPWYPTMRLFRQRNPQDWTVPVQAMVQALR